MASDISGQNSSTMLSSFLRANTFNSGLGSSRREIIPARKQKKWKLRLGFLKAEYFSTTLQKFKINGKNMCLISSFKLIE